MRINMILNLDYPLFFIYLLLLFFFLLNWVEFFNTKNLGRLAILCFLLS